MISAIYGGVSTGHVPRLGSAIEVVRRIDEIFAAEREINGAAPNHQNPRLFA